MSLNDFFMRRRDGQGGQAPAATLSSTDPATAGRERRRAPRFAPSGPCRVAIFDGVEHHRAAGSIRDISAQGMRVRSTLIAVPGMTVQVGLQAADILGEVRHCTRNPDGTYDVGILIIGECWHALKPSAAVRS